MIRTSTIWEEKLNRWSAKSRANVYLLVPSIIVAAWCLVAPALAQTPPPTRRTFDVVSIRPSKSPSGPTTMGNQPGGRFVATSATIKMIFSMAFSPMQDFQVVGGPDWLSSDRFDIEARADDPFGPGEAAAALRTMLEDRFQMKTHREFREMPSYVPNAIAAIIFIVFRKFGTTQDESRITGGKHFVRLRSQDRTSKETAAKPVLNFPSANRRLRSEHNPQQVDRS